VGGETKNGRTKGHQFLTLQKREGSFPFKNRRGNTRKRRVCPPGNLKGEVAAGQGEKKTPSRIMIGNSGAGAPDRGRAVHRPRCLDKKLRGTHFRTSSIATTIEPEGRGTLPAGKIPRELSKTPRPENINVSQTGDQGGGKEKLHLVSNTTSSTCPTPVFRISLKKKPPLLRKGEIRISCGAVKRGSGDPSLNGVSKKGNNQGGVSLMKIPL